MMKIAALAVALLLPIGLSTVAAFSLSPQSLAGATAQRSPVFRTTTPHTPVVLHVGSTSSDTETSSAAADTPEVITPTTTASVSPPPVPALATPYHQEVQLPQNQLDENIFKFNKLLIDTVYEIICVLYPVTGDVENKRNYARFYVLETVARVPYFAYLSVLHLRETFGNRYDKMNDQMRTHYAQADNELHHLLIMESLGGNDNPLDRFVAQSAAFMYYWYVIMIYSVSEPAAYHLSELIEDHAYDTYNKFLTENAEALKQQPVPAIARKYYEFDNPFMFDLFCTVQDQASSSSSSSSERQLPQSSPTPEQQSEAMMSLMTKQRRSRTLESLYDVFRNIRDDEKEHWKTLCNLVQYNDMNAVCASEVESTQPAATAD